MANAITDAWSRLQTYAFDDPDSSFPFSAKVAKENGWSQGFALRVIEEYRRFAYLAVAAGHPVSPSDKVDQAWHIHILYTRQYAEFCRDYLQMFLHHGPSRGGRKETEKYQDWYEKTLDSYRRLFGEEPPADIWPTPAERKSERFQFERVDRAKNWVIPKPRLKEGAIPALAVFLPFLFYGCEAANGATNPLDYDGPSFLGFFVWGGLGGLVLALVLRHFVRPPTGDFTGKLSAEDAAYLNGGAGLVVNSAIASLVQQGLANVVSRRLVGTRTPPTGPLSPLETSLLGASQGNGVYAKTAATYLAPNLDGIRQRLTDEGLLMPPQARLQNVLVTLLAFGAVPGLGLVKLFVGLSRERPVGFLVALLVVSAVVLLLLLASAPKRSRKGDRALEHMRESLSALKGVGQHSDSTPADIAMGVALFGLPALAGAAYYSDLRPLAPSNGSSSSSCGASCGSSCSSSSSSDGGSGGDSGGGSSCGGGGGCGGCGGS